MLTPHIAIAVNVPRRCGSRRAVPSGGIPRATRGRAVSGPPTPRARTLRQLIVLFAMLLALTLRPVAAAPRAADDARALARATFAGGCFWCMEAPFDALEGVRSTTSGYTGGSEADPGYDAVTSGRTGHAEAVEVLYDPARVDYRTLLEVFWLNVDPLDGDGQFCDRGRQYRAAIFVHDAAQRDAAQAMKRELEALFRRPLAIEIVAAGPFYPAEAEHQDYYREHRAKYLFYRYGCGRDARLKALWGAAAGGPVKH